MLWNSKFLTWRLGGEIGLQERGGWEAKRVAGAYSEGELAQLARGDEFSQHNKCSRWKWNNLGKGKDAGVVYVCPLKHILCSFTIFQKILFIHISFKIFTSINFIFSCILACLLYHLPSLMFIGPPFKTWYIYQSAFYLWYVYRSLQKISSFGSQIPSSLKKR